MSKNPIRVLVVDDHSMVRRGLSAFLMVFDDMELVGECSSGETALRLCQEVRPDVVLMDLVMPGTDGITATAAIKQHCPDIKIIALTSFSERKRIQAALKAGAIGYLLKDVSAEQLASAIRGAVSGCLSLAQDAAQVLVDMPPEYEFPGSKLTDSEERVLSLMVTGLSNPEIARRLSISNSTVKFHVSNIFSKLNVVTRTEAVSLALRNHLVD